jgi:hypothetical protein
MNIKLLLVKSITLLYRESQLPSASENSAVLVRNIISNIRLPELSLGVDRERDIIDGLVKTAMEMCESPKDHVYEVGDLLQRLKINTLDEETLYDALYDGIAQELTEAQIKRTCLNIKRSLTEHFREEKVQEIMTKATQQLKFNRNKITDFTAFVAETMTALEPYQVNSETKDPAIVSDVDMHDLEGIEHVFSDIKEMDNGTSILRTGYQGINRMLDGGFRRGEEVVIGALQHKYKTGFSLSLFKQIALYNVPQMIDPTKKPLLARISFEDDITLNFQFLYQSLVENETGMAVDISKVSKREMSRYVQEKLHVNGYHVKFLRVDPTQWTYKDICNKILEWEAEGYEVHMLMLDYLTMVPTTGCNTGPAGTDIRDMYRRMRNFTNPRKITLITPHQLSTDAKRLIRAGQLDFVKEIAGKGFYAGCQSLDNEVDLELYIHIEIVNGESFLTVQRGKHRKTVLTPMADLFCVLPFKAIGGILDDINGQDTTRKRVGGGPIGSGNEIPFWETA